MKTFNKLLYISNKIDKDISFRMRHSKHPDSLYIGYKNISGMIDNIYFIFVFEQMKNIKFYNINNIDNFNECEQILSISNFIKATNLIYHIKLNKDYIKDFF